LCPLIEFQKEGTLNDFSSQVLSSTFMLDHLGESAVRKRHAYLDEVLHRAKLWEDRSPGPEELSKFKHQNKANKLLTYKTNILVVPIHHS
jgi:hypothetical protein